MLYNHFMATIEQIMKDIDKNGRFTFSRSGGPGGQNVNKVNTNVLLIMPVEGFDSLTEQECQRLRDRLKNRINSSDELLVQAQQERSQLRNRNLAESRMAGMVFENLKRERQRKKTQPSRSSNEKRLNKKKKRADIKKNRGKPEY